MEDLIHTRLFEVVGMDSGGFYAPGTPDELDQPCGHFEDQAMDPGDPEADFQLVMLDLRSLVGEGSHPAHDLSGRDHR